MLEIKNYYCNPYALLPQDDKNLLRQWNKEEIGLLYEYMIALNFKAGVKDLFLVNDFAIELNDFAKKYDMTIKSVINAENLLTIPSSMLVGDNIIIEIDKIDEYNENFLMQINDLTAKLKLPLLIHFARDLKTLGRLEQKYKKPPEKVLEDFGFLDRECFLLGCNYLDKDAISFLDNFNVKYIFFFFCDGEMGRGFLNFKLFDGKDCYLASEKITNIDMIKEANLLRLENNNLLCSNNLIDCDNYIKLLCGKCEKQQNLTKILSAKIDKNCEDFIDLKTKFDNLLAVKCKKN